MIDKAALVEIRTAVPPHVPLNPAKVVAIARPPDSALHRYFTWDDQVAAESFRLLEATRVIRAVVKLSDVTVPRTPVVAPPLAVQPPTPAPVTRIAAAQATRTVEAVAVDRIARDITALEARYVGDTVCVRAFAVLHEALRTFANAVKPPVAKVGGDVDRAREIVAELTEFEKQVFRRMSPDGSYRDLSGEAMFSLITGLWQRFPGDDLIAVSERQGRLYELGKRVRRLVA